MTEWDGKERRQNRMGDSDHDVLIEIRGDLKNLITNVDTHMKDDKESFNAQWKSIDFLKRTIWVGIGALSVIQVIVVKLMHIK